MEPRNIIEEIDAFSNYKLKRKDDLKTLIEIGLKNKRSLLEDLSFTAKYILGLQRVLEKGSSNPEITNLEQIKLDYTNNIKKSIEQITEMISLSPPGTLDHFQRTYFELSHQSLQNLNELLKDLEWTKIYFNKQKRKT